MAISSLVVRSLTRAAIPKMFRAGMSASAAARFMRAEVGGFYRRQTFLADWREITGVEKLKESFRYIPKKYRLSFNLMAPVASEMPTKYRYLFRVSGINPETGAVEHAWTSMLDDVRLSPERAEQIMWDVIQDPETDTQPGYNLDQRGIELFVAYRNP